VSRITSFYREPDDGEVKWLQLAEVLAAYQAGRIECPMCASHALEDNGFRTRSTMSFCCTACGEQFDAQDIGELS